MKWIGLVVIWDHLLYNNEYMTAMYTGSTQYVTALSHLPCLKIRDGMYPIMLQHKIHLLVWVMDVNMLTIIVLLLMTKMVILNKRIGPMVHSAPQVVV